MEFKVVIHEADEGGYWAEVPALPGCATQGDTFEELLRNLYEAVEGWLAVDVGADSVGERDWVIEIAACTSSPVVSSLGRSNIMDGRSPGSG